MRHSRYIGATLAVLLLLTVPMAGCIDHEPSSEGSTTKVTDMFGRMVKVPTTVKRVVGVGAGALRLLVYLECTEKVVGVEEIELDGGKPYNFAHPDLAKLPQIGPMHGGDAELIAGQDPDVIFWTYTTEKDAEDLQRKTGAPVVAIDYGDLGSGRDRFYGALDLVAEVMGKAKRAEELRTYIDGLIADLDERTKDIPNAERPATYVGGIGYYGVHGILSTEPAYTPLALVNGRNVAEGLGFDHAFVDKEKILDWDPEVILADEGGLWLITEDLKDPAYADIQAIRDNSVFGVMPYNYYSTNYGTVLANAYYIGAILFPDRFTDVDPVARADEIYTELVGDAVYGDMESMYGGLMKVEVGG